MRKAGYRGLNRNVRTTSRGLNFGKGSIWGWTAQNKGSLEPTGLLCLCLCLSLRPTEVSPATTVAQREMKAGWHAFCCRSTNWCGSVYRGCMQSGLNSEIMAAQSITQLPSHRASATKTNSLPFFFSLLFLHMSTSQAVKNNCKY